MERQNDLLLNEYGDTLPPTLSRKVFRYTVLPPWGDLLCPDIITRSVRESLHDIEHGQKWENLNVYVEYSFLPPPVALGHRGLPGCGFTGQQKRMLILSHSTGIAVAIADWCCTIASVTLAMARGSNKQDAMQWAT